jgi:hypothetical protein
MKTLICLCVSLVLFLPSIGYAGDKHKGGGKAANADKAAGGHAAGAFHAPGGGGAGGGTRGAQVGGGGTHNAGAANLHNGGQTSHGSHGLNTHQGGLYAHHGAQHGLNARNGAGLQGQHGGKFSGNHVVNNRVVNNRIAVHNHFAGHWRSGLGWRNTHALFVGYHRVWHDRWWWGAHYNNVVFVGGPYWGGHWYWDGGYWFPAWGYAPGYVGYAYDGPIYAYANLPPDQVVVNIQEALQDQGYYTGNIDGQFGQLTRDAIAAYQRDHNLEMTAAIDEPTVQALGLNTEQA